MDFFKLKADMSSSSVFGGIFQQSQFLGTISAKNFPTTDNINCIVEMREVVDAGITTITLNSVGKCNNAAMACEDFLKVRNVFLKLYVLH